MRCWFIVIQPDTPSSCPTNALLLARLNFSVGMTTLLNQSAESRKVGCPFFEECARCLMKLRSPEPLHKNVGLLLDPNGDPAAVVFQKLLREPNCRRRQGTDPRHQFDRNVDQLVVFDDTVDEAPSHRRLRIDRLAEKQQLGGTQMSDRARQQKSAGRLRYKAERDERERQPCAARSDDQVAMQQHRRSDADRGTVHGGDQHLLRCRDRAQKPETRAVHAGWGSATKSFKSLPAQNASPAPLNRTALIVASAS